MIAETLPTPVFGRDGEPCPACSAPLAGDQRYCLHCGARRPEARLEFLDVLDADVRARAVPAGPPAVVGAAAVPPATGLAARLQANSGALALGAVLLLTLLVGLLVGHWVTADTPVTAAAPAAPQVIRVEGAAAPAAGATDTTAGAATAGAASAAHAAKSSKKAAAAKRSSTAPPKGAVSVKQLAGDKKAIDKAVKKGKPIATGGTPPPKDDKPAGGGSSFETIG